MSVVILSSVPVLTFGVAQVATSGNALAASLTTCGGGSQTVTFAAPGLSNQGAAQVSNKSTSTTSSASITCTGSKPGTGTISASKIKSKSTLLCSNDTNAPTGCAGNPTDYVYDSAGQFATGGSTLYKDVKTTTWTDKGTTYITANSGSATAGTGTGVGNCPSGEVGFVLTGKLTAPSSQVGKATTITACLNGDTGTNVTNNFANDITAAFGGNKTIVITSSTFDPATSSIQFA